MGKVLSAYPKKGSEKVYYCPRRMHHFSIVKTDKDGKPIQLTNTLTGAPLMDSIGNPLFAEQTYKFNEYQGRLSDDGYWCVFIVNKDTPKAVADYLEKAAADRGSEVITEKEFLKMTNPDLAKRIEEDKAKDDKIDAQQAEIDRLRAQLQGRKQQ